ncbi:DegT/DnrJ/EryC1/StrS family aminotransferase [Arthrobacter sp. AB6]|uniref:DegT/DnrJ/EryC1/StrS family aminotransferase n=1 Tax=Arthrobacter sp. AB6 TaxID=2962570 RepID=UPI0028814E63|nr:DegT/DnrJ/EryC1/StrS family aminotransferase [Arthrobacter sp. AB6]MDT0193791.1 DegT/DnrJ/EryC1/StrS family aminotransferase [Arthrobacter sp. AB6]
MIPISEPDLGPLERRYLLDAFDSGWISSLGPYIERSETALRAVAGARHAAVVSNGTTALHLALLALNVGPGDEVIVPATTYVATLNAVLYVGATPVIVDVKTDTWCIDPLAVEAAISDRSRAIIAVDLYGHPADYDALAVIGTRHGIAIVADAAESLGGSLSGRPVGSLADISTFSFFGNKVVTCGEGGAITTNDPEIDRKIRQLRNQGNHPDVRYYHEVLGYNYRMTNLSAAILTAQLERVSDLIASRKRVIGWYSHLLENRSDIVPQGSSSRAQASPWMFSLELAGATEPLRDTVILRMRGAGVETRPVFRALQQMPYLLGAQGIETPNATRLARCGISLPTYPGLDRSGVEHVVESLISAVDAVHQLGHA